MSQMGPPAPPTVTSLQGWARLQHVFVYQAPYKLRTSMRARQAGVRLLAGKTKR